MDGGDTVSTQASTAPRDGHHVTTQTWRSSLGGNDVLAETCLSASEVPSRQREARAQKRVQVAESLILYVGFFSLVGPKPRLVSFSCSLSLVSNVFS